jgi:PAS domain S-box-containing protein
MVASACLTLAAMHLLIWGKKRTTWASLLFAVMAVATAGMAGGELWLMRAETAREFGMVLRWSHVPYWVVVISLVFFVRLYLRAGRPWLAWTICGMRTVSLLLNFLVGENLNYRTITGLGHVHFLGASVAIAEGIVNPWIFIGLASLVLLVIFAADATLAVWWRGDRWQLVLLGGAIVCFILGGTGKSVLAAWGVIHQPVTPSLFFLGIVVMMAYDMSHEVLRAATLADDLRESEARMSLAAEAAGLGVWVWSIASNQVWGSARWLRLFGFSPEVTPSFEMVIQRIHPDDRETVEHEVRRAAADLRDLAVEYRLILPDGTERWIAAHGRMFLGADGKPARMLGAAIDITGRKQADQKIERQRNELAHLIRVSTVGQLASSLAHELNQPLGAILRNAEAGELFLHDPSPDLDELRAILTDIRTDDQRAGAVIDRMRALMKHRDPDRHRLDLRLVVDDVITLVHAEANNRKVRLARETATALPPVQGDRVQLQQVVLNLLLNAMDALDATPPERRLVTVRARPVGATVEVTVSDTGPGISADTLLRVFEPFFSSKPTGLGMGLAISRDIIEAHGGRLSADNNEAGGATFTLTLPAVEGGDVT